MTRNKISTKTASASRPPCTRYPVPFIIFPLPLHSGGKLSCFGEKVITDIWPRRNHEEMSILC